MTIATDTTPVAERRKALGLLPGSILAACLALVFGACLCTILDALHPQRPGQTQNVLSARAQSSQQPAGLISASY